MMNSWLGDNFIEIFGAATGIIYVFLEIRQTIWLWPLGIITSALYVWIFFTSKLYADMSLQTYYVVISILGWYWWIKGSGQSVAGTGQAQEINDGETRIRPTAETQFRNAERGDGESGLLRVTRLRLRTGIILLFASILLYVVMRLVLSHLTDSPVPGWDAFLTSLSIIATWMLARKIYEHWFLWIVVNIVSFILYYTRGLYPTVVLYFVYAVMSFIGLKAWKATMVEDIAK
jgi:nicotinamide mononucleotide transporter